MFFLPPKRRKILRLPCGNRKKVMENQMAKLFKGKYRTTTTRKQDWDYGWNRAYFVTICTNDRLHYFGQIINGEMHFSEIGKLAEQNWLAIPKHFPFVKLGKHVIMPNHVHGIIQIDMSAEDSSELDEPILQTLDMPAPEKKNKFGPQSKNLASIVRGFKASIKTFATKNSIDFGWQSRYHVHIVKDELAFHNISRYIENNIKNWKEGGYQYYDEES